MATNTNNPGQQATADTSADMQRLKDLQAKLEEQQKQLAELQKKATSAATEKQQKEQKENKKQEALEAQAQAENILIQNKIINSQDYKEGRVPAADDPIYSTARGQELAKAGYVVNSDTGYWEQVSKKATSNEIFDYGNLATDNKISVAEYPMTEITDLVLVDSMTYAGSSGGWDIFSEPQGAALPDQTSGHKHNASNETDANTEVHSLLNKDIPSALAGNLFGLSVDDIGTAMPITDESSASVLKYNYSGYGDPINLNRNLFDDSYEWQEHTRFLGNLNATMAALSNI